MLLSFSDLVGPQDSSLPDYEYSSDLCEGTYTGCNDDGGVCVCALNLTVALCETPFEFATREECQEASGQPSLGKIAFNIF